MTNPRTMGGFDISPRSALAAPTELFVIYIQGLAILVTSVLSVLGAGWMIASFFVSPPSRRLHPALFCQQTLPGFLKPSQLPPPAHPRASHQ